jgi:EAL domain-containing protein (putative c-di-GMP-specific phosphodiesterase class I)
MSTNLSAPDFENDEHPDILQAALRQADNLPSRYVKFEITESEEMIKPEHALQRMEQLTGLGVEIYIDDFGTGLSSLSYLKRLPASALKIDKVFIDEIENDESEREFLKNIINLAKSRNKTIILEGVNSYGQYTILRRLHCDLMQGFYFSPPLTAEKFEQLLKNGGNLLPDAPM